MKPGRELDALIAEKVMGLSKDDIANFNFLNNPDYADRLDTPAPYSTNIVAAWTVVEKLSKQFSSVDVRQLPRALKGPKAKVKLWENPWTDSYIVFGVSAPHAICLAALKALDINA